MKQYYQNGELSLSIQVDPDFRGIVRGFAHDVSEGCQLSGEVVMDVSRRTKIGSLQTDFVGDIGVNFKTTNSIGIPTADGVENRMICKRTVKHFNEKMIGEGKIQNIKSTQIEPGSYKFPFKFAISPALPHSFEGKNGFIRYHMDVTATRKLFSSDIRISHPIILRRCLMNSMNPIASPSQTVHGDMYTDLLTYSATAPSMVYCEGGLLKLDIFIKFKDPTRYAVQMITCGLEERELYRTTGRQSLTNQAMRHDINSYPLGWSTFFPSKHQDYNPDKLHNYNAIFRLYPKVHTDNKSALIAVLHTLKIRIVIEDSKEFIKHKLKRIDSINSLSSVKSVGRSILSRLSKKHHAGSFTSLTNDHPHTTDPMITPPASPTLSSSNSSSNNSMDSSQFNPPPVILPDQLESNQVDIVRVTSRKNTPENSDAEETTHQQNEQQHATGHSLPMHHHSNPFCFRRDKNHEGTLECTLDMPIVVTSREEYKEGSVPALPDYATAVDEPPSYRTAITNLPPVPIYATDESN